MIEGVYPFGAALPGEHALAETFRVSRITVRRALEALAACGLIRRKRGSGTVVVYRPPESPVRLSVTGLLDDVLTIGMQTDIRFLTFDYVPSPPVIAEALGLSPGTLVQHAVRVRTKDGRPFSHDNLRAGSVGRTYSREDLTASAMLVLLRRAGLTLASAEQNVRATLADADLASLLGVEIGSPPPARVPERPHDRRPPDPIHHDPLSAGALRVPDAAVQEESQPSGTAPMRTVRPVAGFGRGARAGATRPSPRPARSRPGNRPRPGPAPRPHICS